MSSSLLLRHTWLPSRNAASRLLRGVFTYEVGMAQRTQSTSAVNYGGENQVSWLWNELRRGTCVSSNDSPILELKSWTGRAADDATDYTLAEERPVELEDLGVFPEFLPPDPEEPYVEPPPPAKPIKKRDIIKRPSRPERDEMYAEAVRKVLDPVAFPAPLRRNVIMRVFDNTRSAQQLIESTLPTLQFWHQTYRGGKQPMEGLAKAFIETCIRHGRPDYVAPALYRRTQFGLDVLRSDALDQVFRYLSRPSAFHAVDVELVKRNTKAAQAGLPPSQWESIPFQPSETHVIPNLFYIDHLFRLITYMHTYYPADDGQPDSLGLICAFSACARCGVENTEAAQDILNTLQEKGFVQIEKEIFDYNRKGITTWIKDELDLILDYSQKHARPNLEHIFDHLLFGFEGKGKKEKKRKKNKKNAR